MILSFKDIPINRTKVKQETNVGFNLQKEDGWKTYEMLTENCENLLNIVNNDDLGIEEAYTRFDKMHTKMKFQSFGKSRRKCIGSIKPKEVEKTPENTQIENILKKRSARLEKENEELKSYSSRPTRAFKFLEKVQGKKRCGPEAVAIVDPAFTNELKTSRKEI